MLLLCQLSSKAQYTISGTLKDTTAETYLEKAVVALVNPADSTLLSFTRTNTKGQYSLQVSKPGNYSLMVMHPQYGDYIELISVTDPLKTISPIALTSRITLLETVIVNSARSMRVKGDTTIYTADSFKVSANANVEELLKKLPGLQVDKNGKITAMGQTVQKVLVDGEEFFGSDPGMAVKNLRADGVQEVQVFDKKSEQAEFTGIDDGKTEKTINLKLKESARNGYFGKLDAAGGLQKEIDDRYNVNALYNNFKRKRKLSGFILNGNTGQDGLAWQDRDKFGGVTDNAAVGNDEDAGVVEINTTNGFLSNTNAGLSYYNKWNNKQDINLSPQYNKQLYNNSTAAYTQTQLLNDSILNNKTLKDQVVDRYNVKLRAVADIFIDSSTSIKLNGNLNFYDINAQEYTNSLTTGKNGNLKNSTTGNYTSQMQKQAFNASALLLHKFLKPKRTISVNVTANTLTSSGVNKLITDNQDFVKNTSIPINQQNTTDKNTVSTDLRTVYTEPLGMKYAMELGYEINFINGFNNQRTSSYNSASNQYDTKVDSLSNNFNQKIITNKPNFKISYNAKNIDWNAGVGVGLTKFDFEDKSVNRNYDRNFTNIFPEASLRYKYDSKATLKVNYRGETVQPSLNQLQPLRNNTDQFNLYIGNPTLKQSFRNNLYIENQTYNFVTDRWIYEGLSITTTANAITNNRTIDPASGQTTNQPVNTNGNIDLAFYSGLGQTIKKIKTRIQLSPTIKYSRFADIINAQKSFAQTLTSGIYLYANKSKDKFYDIAMSHDFYYTVNRNGQTSLTNSFRTYEVGASVDLHYKKVWKLKTDYVLYLRQRLEQTVGSPNNQLWNASLERNFKKDQFTAYFTVRDILNSNIGIDRQYLGNTYSEVVNDRLKRYFLLGFTWNFKNKSKVAPATSTTE